MADDKFGYVPYPEILIGENILGRLSGDVPLFFDPALTMSDALYVKALMDSQGCSDSVVMDRVRNVLREMRRSNAPHQRGIDPEVLGLGPVINCAPPPTVVLLNAGLKKPRAKAAKKKKGRR